MTTESRGLSLAVPILHLERFNRIFGFHYTVMIYESRWGSISVVFLLMLY